MFDKRFGCWFATTAWIGSVSGSSCAAMQTGENHFSPMSAPYSGAQIIDWPDGPASHQLSVGMQAQQYRSDLFLAQSDPAGPSSHPDPAPKAAARHNGCVGTAGCAGSAAICFGSAPAQQPSESSLEKEKKAIQQACELLPEEKKKLAKCDEKQKI
jgi:hypothetical protein